METSFEEELQKWTVQHLIPKDFHLISVLTTDKVLDVLKILREKKILCVPVYDKEIKKFVGLVDIYEIVLYFLISHNKTKMIQEFVDSDWIISSSQNEKFISEEMSTFIQSRRNPWCPIWYKKPLLSLMDMFGKNVNLHRVPVVHDNGEIIGLITQSRVIECLSQILEKFPLMTDRKLKNFVGPSEVISVDSQEQILNAFKLIIEENVSGMPVTDKQGKLVGCLSVSDLKRPLESNILIDLNLPVDLYLKKNQERFENYSVGEISCTLDSTIEDVFKKLISSHIHRLFVVDINNRPVKVISLCDLITIIQSPEFKKQK